MELEGTFRRKSYWIFFLLYMKHQFLKSVLILGSVLAFMNCSDENTMTPETDPTAQENPTPTDYAWKLEANGDIYLIYPSGTVTNANGIIVGTHDKENGTIVGIDNNTIFQNIFTDNLEVTTLEEQKAKLPASSETVPPQSSATVNPPASSANVTTPTSSANNQTMSSANTQQPNSSANTVTSSSSAQQQQQTNSSAATSGNCDGKCFDAPSGKCVGKYDQLTGSKGEKYAYDNDCKLNCYYDPDGKECKNISGAAPASSNAQQQTKSSSSQQQQQQKSSSSQQQQQKSSSSQQQAKSSSSQQQPKSSSSSVAQGSTPNFKIKSGGRSGQGWGSRYWDCCKPHCAWSGKGGPIARTCNASQQTLAKGDDMVKSICDGGPAGLCNSQAPFAINDNLAYAFAAGPGNSYAGSCGSCFLLTFDGNSRHTTDARTQALKGKQMVIMISNIGYDVENGQFDMMIPGGGVGIFNGCSALWGINNLGAQHGGFLKDCGGDKKVNDVATVQKCLEDKCNSVFANIPDAKAGCLFHAQWLMAANNPSFKYEELESCPQELVNKY